LKQSHTLDETIELGFRQIRHHRAYTAGNVFLEYGEA